MILKYITVKHVLKGRAFLCIKSSECLPTEILLKRSCKNILPVKLEDILACFDYAASLAEEQVTPLELLSGEA